MPGARVVKAFNTLFASNQGDPVGDGVQLDGFVAGDDADAKGTVLALVESIGLNPVDVGPLARSRQLEGMAFLNIAVNIAEGGSLDVGLEARRRTCQGGRRRLTPRRPGARHSQWT